jgi:hypothetical protein
MSVSFLVLTFNSEAKYIVLLEGDDSLTDPIKIKKQVDFFEGTGGSICFS